MKKRIRGERKSGREREEVSKWKKKMINTLVSPNFKYAEVFNL
jgi:hypothetical protein